MLPLLTTNLWHNINMSGTTKTLKHVAKSFTLGRQGFARISAIEGIELTAAMEAEFEEFDRKELSAEERRSAIALKYGQSR